MNFDKIYVLDTNIILDNVHNLITLSDNGKNLIILPETVIDEIDSKKNGFNEINFQAREFARLLFEAEIEDKKIINVNGINISLIKTIINNITLIIISKNKYDCEIKNVSTSIINDRKILEITKNIQEYDDFKNLKFISLDVMARTRAISLNIPTEPMTFKNKDDKLEFLKEINLNDKEIKEYDDIWSYDPNYKPYNFSYMFNQNGKYTLAVIQNEKIKFINENDLRKQNINPMNKEQLLFSNALLDDYYNIVISEALAGSGKTLLAISAAMELIKKKRYQRIVYIRNSIESLDKGEDVGYLSGNNKKFEIYNFPLFDTIAYIANKMLLRSKENKPGKGEPVTNEKISDKVNELIDKYQIETMWPGSMRGRTLSNAVVILDECQNMSKSTLQLILTRIDKSCKVIILGSNKQIDNVYINKYTNGLTSLLNSTKEFHEEVNLFAITLNKVLRGPITAFAERILTKK